MYVKIATYFYVQEYACYCNTEACVLYNFVSRLKCSLLLSLILFLFLQTALYGKNYFDIIYNISRDILLNISIRMKKAIMVILYNVRETGENRS